MHEHTLDTREARVGGRHPSTLAPTARAIWSKIWKQGRGGDWRYLREDRLPLPTLLMILAIMTMTILDGILTILLLDHHFEEANPLMRFFLDIHPMVFVIGKYALTAACLPFLIIFGRRRIFFAPLRVAHVLPFILLLYVLLLTYQAAALYRS